jgi:hypothetical protein
VLIEVCDEGGLIFVLDRCAPGSHLGDGSTPGRGILPLLRNEGSAVAQEAAFGDDRFPNSFGQRGDLGGFRWSDDRFQLWIPLEVSLDVGGSAPYERRRKHHRGNDARPPNAMYLTAH